MRIPQQKDFFCGCFTYLSLGLAVYSTHYCNKKYKFHFGDHCAHLMKKGNSYGSSSDAAARAKLQKLKDATPPDVENFKPGVLSPNLLALRMMAPPGPISSSSVEPQQVLNGTIVTSSSPSNPSPLDEYLGTMDSQTLTTKGDLDITNPSSPQNSNASTLKGAADPVATLSTEPSAPNDSGSTRSNGSMAPRYSSNKSLPKPTIAHSSGHKKGRGTVLIPTRPGKKRRGSKANTHVAEEPIPSQAFQVELEQDGSMWVKVQAGGGRKQSMDSNASRAPSRTGNKGKRPNRDQQEVRINYAMYV